MFNYLIKLLFGEPIDFATLMSNGAIVLDVRSAREYENGHIKGAINIPVTKLGISLNNLKDKQRPIITCCASGVRSASATSILKRAGYLNVFNAGSWNSLRKYC